MKQKKKSGYDKSERSVGGTKNPRTDSYSNRAIIVSSELGISDLQSDNAGEPNSDDTGACEDNERAVKNNSIKDSFIQAISIGKSVVENIVESKPVKNFTNKVSNKPFFSQSKKESKPRDNQRKLGKNIDTKA